MMQGQIRVDRIPEQLQESERKLKKCPALALRQHSARRTQGDQTHVLPGLFDILESVLGEKFAHLVLGNPVAEQLGQLLLVSLEVEVTRRKIDPFQNGADAGSVELKRRPKNRYSLDLPAGEPKPLGQQRQIFGIVRNHRTEGQPSELQPVFGSAEKPVGQGQLRLLSLQKQSGLRETRNRFQRRPGTD